MNTIKNNYKFLTNFLYIFFICILIYLLDYDQSLLFYLFINWNY